MILIGMVLLIAASIALGFLYAKWPVSPLQGLDPATGQAEIHSLAPVETLIRWRNLKFLGLSPDPLPIEREYLTLLARARAWLVLAAILGVAGACPVVVGLMLRCRRRSCA